MITTEVGTNVTLIGRALRKNQQGERHKLCRIIIPFNYIT